MNNKVMHKTETSLDHVQKPFGMMGIIKHWGEIINIAKVLFSSGFVPDGLRTWQQAAAIIVKGLELGFPPMYSFDKIYIVGGKAALQAEPMLALIKKNCSDAKIEILETTPNICRIKSQRVGQEPQITTYTYDEVSKIQYYKGGNLADLKDKYAWKNYRQDTLRSRCVSRMKREHFPDVDLGMSYTPEELGADINEDGDIIIEENDCTIDINEPITTEEFAETIGGKLQNNNENKQKKIEKANRIVMAHYFEKDEKIAKYRKNRDYIYTLNPEQFGSLQAYLYDKAQICSAGEKLQREHYGHTGLEARQDIINNWSPISQDSHGKEWKVLLGGKVKHLHNGVKKSNKIDEEE